MSIDKGMCEQNQSVVVAKKKVEPKHVGMDLRV